MAVLSDKDILAALASGKLKIASPRGDVTKEVHASSVDLRLGKVFKIYDHSKIAILDPKNKDAMPKIMRTIEVSEEVPFIIQPGEFILGVTEETITVPDDLVIRVEGRSSLGRLGIIIHSTAGFVDPGFSGTITLEISNINRLPIALYPGMRICQIAIEEMSSPVLEPYDKKKSSKYQHQSLPEESRIDQDPEFGESV
jgi:dCTP deaminase